MAKPTTQEVIAKVTELAEVEPYGVFAIRTQDTPFDLGPVVETSHHWLGRYEEALESDEIDELDGICATSFVDMMGEPEPGAEKLVELHTNPRKVIKDTAGEWGGYKGDHLAILAGDSFAIGTDPGEVIIRDAECLYIFC